MFKRLILMLIIAIAGQVSWATVTSYCLHEQGAGSKHFGHHEHQHTSDDVKSKSEKSQVSKKSATHGDCATCNHHGSLGLDEMQCQPPSTDVLLSHGESTELIPSSEYLSLPERPKWRAELQVRRQSLHVISSSCSFA